MLTGFTAAQDLMRQRLLSRCLLLFSVGLCFSSPIHAAQDPPLSESVVLVLKLVSKTHVKPTTGIVISDDGLVLVPAYLIKEPGEIVVLDDGVDIAINGRPAVIVDKPSAGGLALLQVEGLERPAIVLSANALDVNRQLHLETFPPASFMAKGVKPLWVPVSMVQQDAISRVSVSPETPLPFVTGPIIDECGYLAGLSLALGPQSLELDKFPVVVFTDELSQVFDVMKLDLTAANCGVSVDSDALTASIEDTATEFAKTTSPQNTESASSEQQTEAEDFREDKAADSAPSEDHKQLRQGSSEDLLNSHKPGGVSVVKPPSIWRSIPPWLLLLGIIGLALLLWKGLFLRRLSGDSGRQANFADTGASNPSASEEPDTAPLATNSNTANAQLRSVPVKEVETPDLTALPAGCDAVILIEGWIDADTPFKRYCAVNTGKIDIVIGRGQADINIEHPAISRKHARLVSEKELMTISDLGSSNGTYINSTPCLSGEIMFTESGDEIFLGQVRLLISVVKNPAELI